MTISKRWCDSNGDVLVVGEKYLVEVKDSPVPEFVGMLRAMNCADGKWWFTWLKQGMERFEHPDDIESMFLVEGGHEWLGV